LSKATNTFASSFQYKEEELRQLRQEAKIIQKEKYKDQFTGINQKNKIEIEKHKI